MKSLYNNLRAAFIDLGATAPEFDSNLRPTKGNNFAIVIDSLKQEKPPFDVYAADVTFHFFDELARADVGSILRRAFVSFMPQDERNGEEAADNTNLMTLLSEPEFFEWTDELDERNAIVYKSVSVSFFFN